MKARVQKQIEDYLRSWVSQGVAPGFQLALGYGQKTLGVFCVGSRDFLTARSVTPRTWYDLSSLTKVISGSTLIAFALQARLIPDLSCRLQMWFPQLESSLKDLNLQELLEHRSGLPAVFEGALEDFSSREERQKYFLRLMDEKYADHEARRGEVIYSDVGFMLIGMVLELVYGRRLKTVFSQFFSATENELAYGPLDFRLDWLSGWLGGECVARSMDLEDPATTHRGFVQDPKAQWWLGESAHAGLFGTAAGIERWALEIFNAFHGKSIRLSDKVLRSALGEPSDSRFRFGFDTPTQSELRASQAGRKAPKSMIGHLGYTGCSFWMDLESGIRVTLLCHRHFPGGEAQRLSEERPAFHDWLYQNVFSRLEL